MNDRRIEIEALERRIAQLQYRLFQLRNETPETVPMDLGVREYRAVARFGFERDDRGIAIIGVCFAPDGNIGHYSYMLDRLLLDSLSNSDLLSFWEHVLIRTIKHLAREMYDPEAACGRPKGGAPHG